MRKRYGQAALAIGKRLRTSLGMLRGLSDSNLARRLSVNED
jgi:hypothetical protein